MPRKLEYDPNAGIVKLAVAFEQMHERVRACKTLREMDAYHQTATTARMWLDNGADYDPRNPAWVRFEDAITQVLIITTTLWYRANPPLSPLELTDLNIRHYAKAPA